MACNLQQHGERWGLKGALAGNVLHRESGPGEEIRGWPFEAPRAPRLAEGEVADAVLHTR